MVRVHLNNGKEIDFYNVGTVEKVNDVWKRIILWNRDDKNDAIAVFRWESVAGWEKIETVCEE